VALGDPYATLALLKTRLGITNTNDDTALTNALSAASRAIEGCCGRQFNDAGSATARVYYPDDLANIIVDDFSTASNLVVAADYSNGTVYGTTIASTNYQLEPLNGVVDGTTGWPFYRIRAIQTWYPLWLTTLGYPRASVQITAQWGWAAVPTPVVEACLMLAEETFEMRKAPYGVAGFDQYGSVRVRENPKIYAMLARYIRTPILIA
jgi:hypothetical protein